MAIAFVRSFVAGSSGGASSGVSLGASTAAGNTIVLQSHAGTYTGVPKAGYTSVTSDIPGTTFVQVTGACVAQDDPDTGWYEYAQTWVALNVPAGNHTITVYYDASGAAEYGSIGLSEFSGVAATSGVDKTASKSGTSRANQYDTSITLAAASQQSELIIATYGVTAVGSNASGANNGASTPSGHSSLFLDTNGNKGNQGGSYSYRINTNTTTEMTTWGTMYSPLSGNANVFAAGVASLKAALPTPGTYTVVLTSGTTWTVPDGATSLGLGETWAAGGAGGRGPFASGGGGGAYSASGPFTVTPGQAIYLNFGAPGAARTANGTGATGGDTWFNISSNAAPTLTSQGALAKGGTGGTTTAATPGTAGQGGLASAGIGTTKYSGGNGGIASGASNAATTGGGGAASHLSNGANAPNVTSGVSGAGGAAGTNGGAGGTISTTANAGSGISDVDGGGGGAGQRTSGWSAGSGGLPGGGGGGKASNTGNGGASGGSQIRLTYTIPDPNAGSTEVGTFTATDAADAVSATGSPTSTATAATTDAADALTTAVVTTVTATFAMTDATDILTTDAEDPSVYATAALTDDADILAASAGQLPQDYDPATYQWRLDPSQPGTVTYDTSGDIMTVTDVMGNPYMRVGGVNQPDNDPAPTTVNGLTMMVFGGDEAFTYLSDPYESELDGITGSITNFFGVPNSPRTVSIEIRTPAVFPDPATGGSETLPIVGAYKYGTSANAHMLALRWDYTALKWRMGLVQVWGWGGVESYSFDDTELLPDTMYLLTWRYDGGGNVAAFMNGVKSTYAGWALDGGGDQWSGGYGALRTQFWGNRDDQSFKGLLGATLGTTAVLADADIAGQYTAFQQRYGLALEGNAALADGDDAMASLAASTVTADAAAADDADSATSTADAIATGSLVATDAVDTMAAQADVSMVANATLTDAADALTGAGAGTVTATAATSDAADALASVATPVGTGVVAFTDTDDAVTSTGDATIAATALLTDSNDALVTESALSNAGDAALQDADDTFALDASAGPVVSASSALVDDDDAVTGVVGIISTYADATLADDTDSITTDAGQGAAASVAVSDATDSATWGVDLTIGAALTAADAADVMASTAQSTITADAALTDAADGVVSDVDTSYDTASGSAALVDTSDALVAAAIATIEASAALNDAADALAATGAPMDAALAGFAATDTDDVFAFDVEVAVTAEVTLADQSDAMTGTAESGNVGNIIVTDGDDSIGFSASHSVSADLALIDAADTAFITAEGAPEIGAFANLFDADDAFVFGGSGMVMVATATVTDGDDTATITGTPIIAADLARTDGDDEGQLVASIASEASAALPDAADVLAVIAGPVVAADTILADQSDSIEWLVTTDYNTVLASIAFTDGDDPLVSVAEAVLAVSMALEDADDILASHLTVEVYADADHLYDDDDSILSTSFGGEAILVRGRVFTTRALNSQTKVFGALRGTTSDHLAMIGETSIRTDNRDE